MASSAEKIKELLGSGLSNEVVATAVGVHPSYISELMANDIFREEVVALRSRSLVAASSRDRTWDTLEEKLLAKLDDAIDHGMIYKANDLLRAAAVVNNAKRRGVSAPEALHKQQQVVVLNVPVTVVNAFKKNVMGEVIEVTKPDGEAQSLVTMPAAVLVRELASRQPGNKIYDKLRNHLPESGGTEKER